MQLINTLIFIVQAGISYLLMLAVMCFNGGIFIAIILGLGCGYFFFGLRRTNASQVEEVCH
jgi:copper transporter 1